MVLVRVRGRDVCCLRCALTVPNFQRDTLSTHDFHDRETDLVPIAIGMQAFFPDPTPLAP